MNIFLATALFLLHLKCATSEKNGTKPVLVHVIFRHGERTTFGFYPNDPHKNETFYPVGFGGLTNKGKLEMFKLGEILRDRYGDLLGEDYTSKKVFARSTGIERTQMSAMLVLAGLWPPSKTQKWHPALLWQPIPVLYKEHEKEDLLDPILCDYRAKIVRDYLNNQTIKEKFINPYKDLFSYVSEHTGSKIEDFGDILGIYFVLKCEDDYALQLPDWTKSIYPEPIQTAAGTVYAYVNSNLIANKLNSGYLLQKIINDTNDKIANKLTPPDRKLFLYSGHDTTLGYMLDTLKVLKPPHVPPYGSAIVMEIYEKLQNYYIKVSYLKHPLNPQIEELTLPGCEALCPWDEFVKMVAPVLPSVSYEELCSGGITNSSNA